MTNRPHEVAEPIGAMAAAVVSADPEFRRRLGEILAGDPAVQVVLEVSEPYTEITDTELQEMKRSAPELVFVDLEADPHVGLKFAEFLLDSSLARAVVGAGRTDSPELLLQAMRAGVLEFLPKPLEPEAVEAAVDRARKKTGKTGIVDRNPGLGRVLTVFSPKGGTGATTFAVNLAVAIHQISRRRTLIVDLDLELGETALLLGMEPRFSSVDLVRNFHRVDEGLLASYIERHESGVDLLSAPYQPADFQTVDGERMGKILAFLRQHYDYIVIDAPKTLNPVALSAFEASDQLFLLCTADLQSLRNVVRSVPLLEALAGNDAEDWIRLVVNRYNRSLTVNAEEVEGTLGMKVAWTLEDDFKPVMDSINEGRPAVLRGRSVFAESVRAVAAEVTGVPSGGSSGSGLLGRLVSALRNGRSEAVGARRPSESTSASAEEPGGVR